jgi:hypothetical protein
LRACRRLLLLLLLLMLMLMLMLLRGLIGQSDIGGLARRVWGLGFRV